jgi:hypothetical protein
LVLKYRRVVKVRREFQKELADRRERLAGTRAKSWLGCNEELIAEIFFLGQLMTGKKVQKRQAFMGLRLSVPTIRSAACERAWDSIKAVCERCALLAPKKKKKKQ